MNIVKIMNNIRNSIRKIPELNHRGLEYLALKPGRIISHAEALREVRELIKNKQQIYICYAIDHVLSWDAETEQRIYLQQWITSMLENNSSYGQWYESVNCDMGFSDNQDFYNGRLAWLNYLIGYLEQETVYENDKTIPLTLANSNTEYGETESDLRARTERLHNIGQSSGIASKW